MDKVVAGEAGWTSSDLARTRRWIHEFSPEEAEEIARAAMFAKERGHTLESLTADDFPLPTVRRRIEDARAELETGTGLYHFRGVETDGIDKEDLRFIYWGLGLHIGTAVSQSSEGDYIGDVRDFGTDADMPGGRGYTSNQKLNFHTDNADVVGLFALRVARSGGLSMIASSVAIHNELAVTRPDLLEILYQPFHWYSLNHEALGGPRVYPQPVFTVQDGHFSCMFSYRQIMSAQKVPETPRLSAMQEEALEVLNSMAQDDRFCFSFMFRPGDLQLLNNHVCLHARTGFQDYEEPERKRHLLRIWLSVPNSRPLSPDLKHVYADQAAGAIRGGHPSLTGKRSFQTRSALA